MREDAVILAEFDDPAIATPPLNEVDSTTNSIRDRVLLETMLDIRALLVEVKTAIEAILGVDLWLLDLGLI